MYGCFLIRINPDKPYPVYVGDVEDVFGSNPTFTTYLGVTLTDITEEEIIQAYQAAYKTHGVKINDITKLAWIEKRFGTPK